MIVTMGEALVDLFALPIGSSVATATSYRPCVGGAPANVSVILGLSGVATRLVGAVGRDGHGDRLVAALSKANVDTSCVVRVAERTGVTFVCVADDGARSFLFYRQGGADYALSRGHLCLLPTHPLDGATWLHLGSSVFVTPALASATRWLLDEAQARGVKVSVDINIRAHLWDSRDAMVSAVGELCRRAAWVKASEEDLVGMGLPATLEALAAYSRGAVPVVTLAERGAMAKLAGKNIVVPAVPTTTVDETGAGDAFAAGVLAVLHRGGDLSDVDVWTAALKHGCALGSQAVTAIGATEAFWGLADEASGSQKASHAEG